MPRRRVEQNTVYTFLSRLEHKGLVAAEGSPKRYAAVIGREECVRQEEESFLNKVYHGSAGNWWRRSWRRAG